MKVTPRNLALLGVVGIYLALSAILGAAIWDDHHQAPPAVHATVR